MKISLIAGLTLLGVAAVTPLEAQTPAGAGPGAGPPSGEVRGTVMATEADSPVPGATVAVRSRPDQALVAGGFVREDGSFRLTGLPPGVYYVRAVAIGRAPQNSPDFTLAPGSMSTNVGVIRLEPQAVVLERVEVTGQRSAVVIEPDRNSYRASDVAPAASNASEVLENTPSVEVDADGKVSLRGNENVAVQINGRPAPIRGAQLGAYLKQLPAGVIDRIEVIPTPSARHDPEGMAGIINIVMKQNVDLGLSYGFTIGASPANRYNLSGNVGYQAGRLTLFTTYGFNHDERNVVGINDRERFNALGATLSITEQDVDGETMFGGHNASVTADYRLNARDVLTNVLSFNLRRSTDESLSEISELDGNRSPLDRYDRLRDSDQRGNMIDYTLGFRRTIEARRHELSSELRFNRSSEEDLTDLWRQQPPSLGSPSPYSVERNAIDGLTQQLTAQVDYTRPLGAQGKLETGYRGNGRWTDRDYVALVDELGDGGWQPSNLSNSFEMDEQVHAAYGVVSRGVGRVELQGGLRAEWASREFRLSDPADRYPYDYGSLFPSAAATYKLSDADQLRFSYSRRIRRPGTQELNPFPVFFDAQNVFIGNPELNPEYTDAIELSFNRTGRLGTFQVSPFYRRTSDIIRFIIDTDAVVDGRQVTSVSFENLATGNSWGSDVNGSLRLGPKLNAFGGFNIFKMVTDGGSVTSLSSDAVTWSARVNASSQITSALTVQAMYFYRAPMNVERGKFSAQQMASMSVRHRLNPRSTVALRVTDPFNTLGFRVEVGDDNLLQITERKFGARAVHLTYQYSFGQAPRVRQPQPQQEPPVGFPGG